MLRKAAARRRRECDGLEPECQNRRVAPSFREQFPVLERYAYLNAGTEGPVPQAAEDAVRARVHLDLTEGRVGKAYFDEVMELAARGAGRLRDGDGRRALEVALTELDHLRRQHGAGGLSLAPGDEIVTSDQEHPGVLAAAAPRAGGPRREACASCRSPSCRAR